MGRSILAEPAMIGTWRERAEKTRTFLASMGTPGKLIGGRTRAKYPKFGRISRGWEHHADGIDYVLSQLTADKAQELNALLFPEATEKREGSEGLSPFKEPVFIQRVQEQLNDIAAASPLMSEVYHNAINDRSAHMEATLEMLASLDAAKAAQECAVGMIFNRTANVASTDKATLQVQWGKAQRETYSVQSVDGRGFVIAVRLGDNALLTFHKDNFAAVAR